MHKSNQISFTHLYYIGYLILCGVGTRKEMLKLHHKELEPVTTSLRRVYSNIIDLDGGDLSRTRAKHLFLRLSHQLHLLLEDLLSQRGSQATLLNFLTSQE